MLEEFLFILHRNTWDEVWVMYFLYCISFRWGGGAFCPEKNHSALRKIVLPLPSFQKNGVT